MGNCNCGHDCGENCKCKSKNKNILTKEEKIIVAKAARFFALGKQDKANHLLTSSHYIKDKGKRVIARDILASINNEYIHNRIPGTDDNNALAVVVYLNVKYCPKQLGTILNRFSEDERKELLSEANQVLKPKPFLARVFENIRIR